MDERQARDHALVAQVGEVVGQLGRREHPLVDQGARGAGGDRQLRAAGPLGHAADHVELALPRQAGLDVARGGDEQVADDRRGGAGRVAHVVGVDRHVAPAEHALALGVDDLLQAALDLVAPGLVAGQEADGDAVAPGRGEARRRDRSHERIRHPDEDPGTVARGGVRALGAAMLEVLERYERALDDRVRGVTVQLRHEGDTTGVVLVSGVVEAVGPGRSRDRHERFRRDCDWRTRIEPGSYQREDFRPTSRRGSESPLIKARCCAASGDPRPGTNTIRGGW